MYRCALVVPGASLGKVYAVLHRRNSQILSEDMRVSLELAFYEIACMVSVIK